LCKVLDWALHQDGLGAVILTGEHLAAYVGA